MRIAFAIRERHVQRITFAKPFNIQTAVFLIVVIACGSQLPSLGEVNIFAAASPGWAAEDIGLVGIGGDATVEGAEVIVSGAGVDVWGAADALFFFYQSFGQGEFTARVLSEQNTSPHAKAGVDFRQTLLPTSAHVILDVKPDGGVEFMTRPADGAPTTFVAGALASFPVSLKLSHAGPTITGWMSTDNGQSWNVVGAATLTDGSGYMGLAVTSHDPTQLNTARFDMVRATIGAPATGWSSTDIGPVSLSGTTLNTGGTLSISGEGADIWGTSDSFFFVHQSLNGDAQLTARVTSVPNTNPYAKAGLMIRQTLDPGSSDVILDVKPDGGIEFMSRTQPNAETVFIGGGAGGPLPVWLRLVRTGLIVTGYASSDRTNWIVIGNVAVAMSSDVEVGLAVTSHAPSLVNTSVFDNVELTQNGLPDPWTLQDVGQVTAAGHADYSSGTFTVAGDGSDIWGTADSFTFAYENASTQTGSFHTIIARVTSIQPTDPYAKAGIMVRSSLTATSASVTLDVTPAGQVEFMARFQDGAPTWFIGGAAVDPSKPVWLQLTINGPLTALISTDGIRWTSVGSIPVMLIDHAGLAVTSHSPGVLNTSTFDRVEVYGYWDY